MSKKYISKSVDLVLNLLYVTRLEQYIGYIYTPKGPQYIDSEILPLEIPFFARYVNYSGRDVMKQVTFDFNPYAWNVKNVNDMTNIIAGNPFTLPCNAINKGDDVLMAKRYLTNIDYQTYKIGSETVVLKEYVFSNREKAVCVGGVLVLVQHLKNLNINYLLEKVVEHYELGYTCGLANDYKEPVSFIITQNGNYIKVGNTVVANCLHTVDFLECLKQFPLDPLTSLDLLLYVLCKYYRGEVQTLTK